MARPNELLKFIRSAHRQSYDVFADFGKGIFGDGRRVTCRNDPDFPKLKTYNHQGESVPRPLEGMFTMSPHYDGVIISPWDTTVGNSCIKWTMYYFETGRKTKGRYFRPLRYSDRPLLVSGFDGDVLTPISNGQRVSFINNVISLYLTARGATEYRKISGVSSIIFYSEGDGGFEAAVAPISLDDGDETTLKEFIASLHASET